MKCGLFGTSLEIVRIQVGENWACYLEDHRFVEFTVSEEWIIGIRGLDMPGFGSRCGQNGVQSKLAFVTCAQKCMSYLCSRKVLVRELVVASSPFRGCR